MSDPMRTRLIKLAEDEALSITWYCLDGTEHHQLVTCPPRATRDARRNVQTIPATTRMYLDAVGTDGGKVTTEVRRQQVLTQPTNPKHGVDCPKKSHRTQGGTIIQGMLHSEHDDTPYNVDGCSYCGRCHTAL